MSADYKRLFIKDNALVFTGLFLEYLKGLILLPIFIKNLGVSLYGFYTLIIYTLTFFYLINGFGIGFQFRRYGPAEPSLQKRKELFYSQFYLGIFSVFFICILCIWAKNWLNIVFPQYFSIYVFCAVLIAKVIRVKVTEYFRFTNRMKYFVLSNTLTPYLEIMFILFAVYYFKTPTLNALLWSILLAMSTVTIIFSFKIFKEIGFSVPKFDLKAIREDIRMGLPLVLSSLVDFFLSSSDRFILAFFLSTVAVGSYNPGYTLGSLILIVPKVLSVVLLQLLARATDEGNQTEALKLIHYSLKIFFLVGIPFVAGSYFLSFPVLRLLANEQVAQAAWLVTPVVAFGSLFYGGILIFNSILFVKLKTKIIFQINACAAFLNILFNLIGLCFYKSIIVAAVTTLVSYFLSFVILGVKYKDLLKTSIEQEVLTKCLIATMMMSAFLYFARQETVNILATVCVSLLGCLAYVMALWFLGVFRQSEIVYFKKLFARN